MRVVLLEVELLARGRITPVLDRMGAGYAVSSVDALPSDADLVIVDLDRVRVDRLHRLIPHLGSTSARVVGFLSHVNEELAAEAAAAGIEVFPRGRFWRELPKLLEDQPG